MDADEIADIRSRFAFFPDVVKALAALEQARKERDEAQVKLVSMTETVEHWITKAHEMATERDAAQQSAKDARALAINECELACRELAQGYCKGGWDGERMGAVRCMNAIAALRARIADFLEPKS